MAVAKKKKTGTGRKKSGLMAAFAKVFEQVNGDAFNEAYGNTTGGLGGSRWHPEDGEYYVQIQALDAAEQEKTISSKERDGQDPSVMFWLPMTVTQALDEDVVGSEFSIGYYLNPWEDPKTGQSVIIAGQTLKGLCQVAFDEIPDTIEECIAKLLDDGPEHTWEIRVTTKEGERFPEYEFIGLAPEDEDSSE